MELAKYKACICEGSAESAEYIMDRYLEEQRKADNLRQST